MPISAHGRAHGPFRYNGHRPSTIWRPNALAFFAGQSREQMRRMYLESWRKFNAKQPLEPLEAQLAAVIAEHAEYLEWIEAGESAIAAEFTPESGRQNPFLHMGLHLAIREQVATNRPDGITDIHRELAGRLGGAHDAEHMLIEVLAETLWSAQRSGQAPDEQAYLEKLRSL